jgi:hypothetical protein
VPYSRSPHWLATRAPLRTPISLLRRRGSERQATTAMEDHRRRGYAPASRAPLESEMQRGPTVCAMCEGSARPPVRGHASLAASAANTCVPADNGPSAFPLPSSLQNAAGRRIPMTSMQRVSHLSPLLSQQR